MNSSRLDFLLRDSACIGAFVVDGEDLRPLSDASRDAHDTADRTRALWASLLPVVSDAGIVIGKRPNGMSIASENGGLIVESKGAVNVGMVRAAMQCEEPVVPVSDTSPDVDPKRSKPAIWTLAEWIEDTEALRHIMLHIGATDFSILVRKSKFAMLEGGATDALTQALLTAARNDIPVELSLEPLPDQIGPLDLTALDLFGAKTTETDDWLIDQFGVPTSIPHNATFAMTRDVAALAQRLTSWGEGEACELSVLRQGKIKQVIATINPAGDVSLESLERDQHSIEGL